MKRTETVALDVKKRCIRCSRLKKIDRFGYRGYPKTICFFCCTHKSEEGLALYEREFDFANFYRKYPEELNFRSDEFSLKETIADENLSSWKTIDLMDMDIKQLKQFLENQRQEKWETKIGYISLKELMNY